jgi:hypothetical protein
MVLSIQTGALERPFASLWAGSSRLATPQTSKRVCASPISNLQSPRSDFQIERKENQIEHKQIKVQHKEFQIIRNEIQIHSQCFSKA